MGQTERFWNYICCVYKCPCTEFFPCTEVSTLWSKHKQTLLFDYSKQRVSKSSSVERSWACLAQIFSSAVTAMTLCAGHQTVLCY